MKTYPALLLAAALVAGGCQSLVEAPRLVPETDITVNFQDPEKFTDVREYASGPFSQGYLNELSRYLKDVASRRLAQGQKLTIDVTDIDLAGDILPGRTDDIRIVREIYIPRIELTFRLVDATGTVISEGQRRLADMNFMQNLTPINQSDPLKYDKSLLLDWVRKEFPAPTKA